MKSVRRWMSGLAFTAMAALCGTSFAQDCNEGDCGPRNTQPCPEIGPSTDCIGQVGPMGQRYLGPGKTAILAAQDNFAPQPLYTYGPAGLDATRMDYWNRNTAAPQYLWHGNHNYWRYGQPTALIVPPTAAFQTEYNWGVGQTRSMPIYHQFTGGANGGVGGMTSGNNGLSGHPYWPQSTSQYGIYPVRGPW